VKISICLPNLNTVRFLPERIRSIRAQTFTEYEVIVCDNFSDDGAYEVFQNYARTDSRVVLSQKPREGLYANWNNCVSLAGGDWIYIATSDDTMKPDCLEKLLEAGLKSGADVVASPEWMLDEQGNDLPEPRHFARRVQAWLQRRPTHGGFLDARRQMLCGMIFGTPIISITQFLIRREVFDRTGSFPTMYGSAGDFYWQMKALGMSRWYFHPEPLGAWRVHATQATPTDMAKRDAIRSRMVVDLHNEGLLPGGWMGRLALGLAASWTEGNQVQQLGFVSRMTAQLSRIISWRGRLLPRLTLGLVASC
jgi:glycosyltransferase involved in cell wall biosynthesis